jgi:hypothetical protein
MHSAQPRKSSKHPWKQNIAPLASCTLHMVCVVIHDLCLCARRYLIHGYMQQVAISINM